MKKKRIASLLLAGVMTVSALTGCGGGGQESGDSAPEVSGETTAEQKADGGSKEAKNVKDTLTLAAIASISSSVILFSFASNALSTPKAISADCSSRAVITPHVSQSKPYLALS